ncbi:MAG: hypothetical protein P8Y24_11330 [Gammaproteobacteria bacterium]
MKRNEDFSDEILNAFIDEQLDHDEREEILSALRYDEALTRRVCDLQKVRGLIQLAYPERLASAYSKNLSSKKMLTLPKGLAAGILMMLGVLAGWFAHQEASNGNSLIEMAKTIRNNSTVDENQEWKVMLHVSHDEPRRFDVLLKETEHLLEEYKTKGQALQVEILANGKGINLLKNQESLQAAKLLNLKAKYSNLMVSVCGQMLKRI